MQGITLQELQEIKETGKCREDWEDGWKDYFIRDFAKMQSIVFSLSDSVNYVIDVITREKGD